MEILYVSNDPRSPEWLRRVLGPEWNIRHARDGVRALRAIRGASPKVDVLVTEQLTEPYGCFGTTRDAKLLDDPPAVVILLDRSPDTWLAKWAGADRWFLRPADPFEVSSALAELTRTGSERPAGSPSGSVDLDEAERQAIREAEAVGAGGHPQAETELLGG